MGQSTTTLLDCKPMKYLSILILLALCSPANAQLFGLGGQRSIERTVTYSQPMFGLGSVATARSTVHRVLPQPVVRQAVVQPVRTTVKRTRRVLRRVPMTFVRTVMQKRCELDVNGRQVCRSYPVQTTRTEMVEVWVDVQE